MGGLEDWIRTRCSDQPEKQEVSWGRRGVRKEHYKGEDPDVVADGRKHTARRQRGERKPSSQTRPNHFRKGEGVKDLEEASLQREVKIETSRYRYRG